MVNHKMKKREISVAIDPDNFSTGHSKKRALILLTVSIAICWVAMEICDILAIAIPIPTLISVHVISIALLCVVYRWLQLKAQREGSV